AAAPGAIAGKLEELEDLTIDGVGEEDLGELILSTLADFELGDDLLGDAEKVRAGDAVLVVLDLILDPLQIQLAQRWGGISRHGRAVRGVADRGGGTGVEPLARKLTLVVVAIKGIRAEEEGATAITEVGVLPVDLQGGCGGVHDAV